MRKMNVLGGLVCVLLASAGWADEPSSSFVEAKSLRVKERLIAIEQINVSAEKPLRATTVDSDRVEALLQQAEELDEQAGVRLRAPAGDQSATH